MGKVYGLLKKFYSRFQKLTFGTEISGRGRRFWSFETASNISIAGDSMANEESTQRDGQQAAALLRETRIDAAHSVQRAAVAQGSSELVAAASGEGVTADRGRPLLEAGTAPEVLDRQAANLADHLQSQLGELDRREARLNSQEAEFETRIRNARLWLDERETELDQREQSLNEQEKDFSDCGQRTDSSFEQVKLNERAEHLDEVEQHATRLQAELEVSQSELQDKLNELELQTAISQTKQEECEKAKQDYEQRQRELDEREAEIYKQIETCTGNQVSLEQRSQNMNSASKELDRRQEELKEWGQRLGEQASEAEWRRAEFDRVVLEQELLLAEQAERERRLKFREQEIKTAVERFERLGITERKMVELQQKANEFEVREAYLSNAESLLAEQQVQLADRERELERQELAFENQVTRERRELQSEEELEKVARSQRHFQLDQREGELEQRQAALEQLQEELGAAQREVLEMRLATEETWLQLQGALAPATLSRSIAQVRIRLADHFQLAAEGAKARRREMETVRVELAEQHQQFQQQHSELESWVERRERDLELRAARLVAREKELDQQQRQYENDQKSWHHQQLEYQKEIQQLLAAQRQTPKSAA